ncbi:MAG: hypothetical protein U0941_03125 [Planctomycetaceae bacterium]
MGLKLKMCGLLTFVVLTSQVANAQNPLPPDADTKCTLTQAQFASWFASGVVTPNGIVKPADSLNFKPNSLCSFYQWSTQMFLWLNSPAYGTGGRVFDSPIFYDVEPVTGGFVLVPNTVGRIRTLSVRSAQVDASGKQLAVNAAGVVSQVETGQAGGSGTLLSQNGSLVYYSIHVNDVFAYMFTGTKTTPPQVNLQGFPTTAADLKQITDFASQKLHKQIFDPTALAMELKISWVDAATVPNPQDYITMTALVPTYNFSVAPVNGIWPTGPLQQKLLAMVGMHVVGSTAGHPEMIWATFEHVNNAPNGAYSYRNKSGATVPVPLNPQGKWLFNNGAANPNPFNVENLKTVSTGIQQVNSTGPKPVASNTIRTFAWGGAQGNAGVENNTEIISLNNAVIGMLGSDIRKNYVHIGSVWTGGQIPPNGGTLPAAAQSIGSVLLSNATMETYHQVIPNPPTYTPATGFNCFTCHNTGTPAASSANLSQLSHIWSSLKPLK